MSAVAGLMLIAAGAVAAVTGEFDGDRGWLLAIACAVVGVVGLLNVAVSTLTAPTT